MYKTSTGPKPLRIKLDKVDWFIRVRGGECRHLLLFDYELFDKICDTFHNVVILNKSVFNKNKNNYYYNVFLEKVRIKINQIHDIFKWMFVYYKCYFSVELTLPKKLMLIKQVHQKNVISVTIGVS